MRLTDKDIGLRLPAMPGWHIESNALTRTFELKSFPDAVAFVTRLAFEAEAADHHPDLNINYKRVTVSWSVAGKRSAISGSAGVPWRSETPISPWSARQRKLPYWTMIG